MLLKHAGPNASLASLCNASQSSDCCGIISSVTISRKLKTDWLTLL